MDAVVRAAEPWRARNPALRVLAGRLPDDQCHTLILADQLDAAVEPCDRAVAAGDYHRLFEQRARLRRHRKEYALALADLARAAALAPQHADYPAMRADLEARLGRFDDARASLERAWLLDAHAPEVLDHVDDVQRTLRIAAQKTPRPDDALALLTRAVELDSDSADVLAQRGYHHHRAGHFDEARRDLETALRFDPGHYESCKQLDQLLGSRRDFAAIVPILNRFLELEPDDARGWLERAGTLHHLGRDAEARADLRRACSMKLAPACALEARLGPPPKAP